MNYRVIELNGDKRLLKKEGKTTLTIRFNKEKTSSVVLEIQKSLTESFEERIKGKTSEKNLYVI